VIVWNRSRKRDDWGQQRQRPRPHAEWTHTVDESLRIIPDDLWNRVASRRRDTEGKALRFESSRKTGRTPEYVCHRHRYTGSCTNVLRIPVSEMNEAVLQAVEEHVFTPEAIEQVIALTERDELRDRQDLLRAEYAEYKDVERRIARLTAILKRTRVSISFRFWLGYEHSSSGRPPLTVSWRCCSPCPGCHGRWCTTDWTSGGDCCVRAPRKVGPCYNV
jgi:hypothetical protein